MGEGEGGNQDVLGSWLVSRHCPNCSQANSTALLIAGARLGRVIGHTPQTEARRRRKSKLPTRLGTPKLDSVGSAELSYRSFLYERNSTAS